MPTTRSIFTMVLLALSLSYTVLAFGLIFTTTAGRIGPGFFPRIVGGLLVVALATSLVVDVRRQAGHEEAPHGREVAVLCGLAVLFMLAMIWLGGLIGMIVFTLVTLTYLNREHPVHNLLIGIGFPVGLYVLFDVLLNASLPRGALPFFN